VGIFSRLDRGSTLQQVIEAFNRTVDRDAGQNADASTQIRWTQYDGVEKDPHTAVVLASNNHTHKVRNTAGKHIAVLLAATSKDAVPTAANSVLLVEDTGLQLGVGKVLRLYDAAGTDYAELASDADGSLVLTGSGANSGRLTINNADASATIRTLVSFQEAGVAKVKLGLTPADLFAVLDPTGAVAVVTVDPATGNTAVAGTLLVSGAATLASGSVTGAWSIGGTATRAGAEVLSGAIDATLTANTDNWAPTGVATARIIRIGSTGGPWNLTGIAAPTGPVRQVLTLRNVSGVNVVLIYNSGSSLAGNRFVLPNGVNVTIAPQGALTLWYDTATAAWAPLDRAS
jgi:hypothetical protein